MKFGLLLSTIFLIVISGFTQTPPMPLPPAANAWVTNTSRMSLKRQPTFTANCPHCGGKFKGLRPFQILTNGGISTNGGTIVFRTLSFACPNLGCGEKFDSQNTKFIPASVATEDPPDSASITPMQTKAMLVATTWTTDPNLRLFIQRTNILEPVPWPMTINFPAEGGTGTVSVLCGPSVIIRYQTETNKTYQCQATDDGAKSWLGSTPVVGDGRWVTNFEAMRTNRMYRVVEL